MQSDNAGILGPCLPPALWGWRWGGCPPHQLTNTSAYEKALRETQTLRAKIFAPLQTPFPRAQDRQNLISWRWSLPSPTDPVW